MGKESMSRRRKCTICGRRWSTNELPTDFLARAFAKNSEIVEEAIMVVKEHIGRAIYGEPIAYRHPNRRGADQKDIEGGTVRCRGGDTAF